MTYARIVSDTRQIYYYLWPCRVDNKVQQLISKFTCSKADLTSEYKSYYLNHNLYKQKHESIYLNRVNNEVHEFIAKLFIVSRANSKVENLVLKSVINNGEC